MGKGQSLAPLVLDMRAATRWSIAVSIPGLCKPSWAIARSPAPRAMPRWHRAGSKTSGAEGIFNQQYAHEHLNPLPTVAVISSKTILKLGADDWSNFCSQIGNTAL